uniref:C-type lectin domain-containing protein n=1 Tax=Acanthochromis polyacanthus TaxID=80966 RepID=A0A3Q1ER96_9TELE
MTEKGEPKMLVGLLEAELLENDVQSEGYQSVSAICADIEVLKIYTSGIIQLNITQECLCYCCSGVTEYTACHSTVFCSFALGSSNFHLINLDKSYEEARSYCRERNADLATIHNSTDMNSLILLVSNSTPRAWIGLEIGNPWKWSDGSNSSFRFWRRNQPNYNNMNQDCVAAVFNAEGQWNDLKCSGKRNLICRGGSQSASWTPPSPPFLTLIFSCVLSSWL